MTEPAPRRSGRRAAALMTTFVLALAACGGSDSADEGSASSATIATTGAPRPTEPTATEPIATEPITTDAVTTTSPESSGEAGSGTESLDSDASDLGDVVALAEEFLLADLLALGIEPIASTATVDTAGFQGLDEFDTSSIEVLPMTTLSLERLASLEPDTIVTLQFWADQIGEDILNGLGDVIIVPDGLYGPERLTAVGELLDRPEHAAARVADYDAALATAQGSVPDDCVVSLATIYPGPSVAAFVDGPWEIPSTLLEVGCALDPDATVAAPDQNGRAWLSLEQLGILDSDVLVLMQSETVEGETDAVDEIEANPIWRSLPAVQSDDVIVIDRLGYPGTTGQIRLLGELGTAMAS